MPAVEQADAEKLLTDWLFTLVNGSEVPGVSGWSVGTTIKPGTTPANAIRVRTVGGVEEQRVADRPRLDVRLWGDGSYLTEGTVKRNARAVLARLRRDFRAIVVADPVALPDPVDPTRTHVMFTVELLTRGVQV
jgi:hypothetical protein